jgi:hypothetical protein
MPAKSGAPDARAIPRHNGRATKNTTMLAGKSYLMLTKILFKVMLFIRNGVASIKP